MKTIPLAALLLALPLGLGLSEGDDRAAVERAAKDYVEALYQVKPELIDRSVHPALEKIGCYRPPRSEKYRVPGKMTFEQLRNLAANWNVNQQQGKDLEYKVEVLDVMDMTASVKLTAKWGLDYMHLIKRDGQWKIIHILWQSHPPQK